MVLAMKLKSSRIVSTEWRRTSAGVAELLQKLGRNFFSSEEKGRTELSYASARGDEYVAPPVENLIPIPIPAPASSCCLGSVAAPFPPMEEITEEATFICDNLDGLLMEADEERARDLQEGPSNLVVCSPPRVRSQEWRRLNGIH